MITIFLTDTLDNFFILHPLFFIIQIIMTGRNNLETKGIAIPPFSWLFLTHDKPIRNSKKSICWTNTAIVINIHILGLYNLTATILVRILHIVKRNIRNKCHLILEIVTIDILIIITRSIIHTNKSTGSNTSFLYNILVKLPTEILIDTSNLDHIAHDMSASLTIMTFVAAI